VTDDQQSQAPATPLPISTGQTIGHLAASFAATVIVLLVQFGVPISPEQQSAILSVIVTGWAFGSTIYAFWHRSRVATIATYHAQIVTQSDTPVSNEPS
jgi:hypothetical protein